MNGLAKDREVNQRSDISAVCQQEWESNKNNYSCTIFMWQY